MKTRMHFKHKDVIEGNLLVSFSVDDVNDKFSEVSILNEDGVDLFNKDPKKYVSIISSYLIPYGDNSRELIESLILESWRVS